MYYDESCVEVFNPHIDCVAPRVARKSFRYLPKCWNYNATIFSGYSCRSPVDGSDIPFCLELAFTQTAFIAECGNRFQEDDHCGTYLEIHEPGDPEIVSDVKLKQQLPSGYRSTIISMTYKGDEGKILCNGPYEVWSGYNHVKLDLAKKLSTALVGSENAIQLDHRKNNAFSGGFTAV